MWRMDIRSALIQAGSPSNISTAFQNRGIEVTPAQVTMWKQRNALPTTEWTGKTTFAPVICELIVAMGYEPVSPADLCPGAGQYMQQPTSEAA